jgi:ABC-type multidrug transport system ATPase subunit
MNGECEFSNFSTGERQRIQIATILAFRDLILNGKISSNIFVIDEFLDSGIDAIAIKNVLSILNKKSIESNQNIFIISHRQETTESVVFNHIIEVVKENGKSMLKIN